MRPMFSHYKQGDWYGEQIELDDKREAILRKNFHHRAAPAATQSDSNTCNVIDDKAVRGLAPIVAVRLASFQTENRIALVMLTGSIHFSHANETI